MYFPPRLECETRSIFKQSKSDFNLMFSFFRTGCHTKVKEPSLSTYLAIAGGRIVGFLPLPLLLAATEI